MDQWFASAVEPPTGLVIDDSDSHWWLVFRDGELLIVAVESGSQPVRGAAGWGMRTFFQREMYLGRLAGGHAWAAELPSGHAVPEPLSSLPLRATFDQLGEDWFVLAGRAAQLLAWDRDHRFCGRCGAPTVPVSGERARRCLTCHLDLYPRLTPAIIVLIERDGQVLLAQGRGMPPNRYGVIAGFVEPGESLEEAVQREIDEEVGLQVDNVTYFSSQPWPFPHTIMLGFTARHVAGEIDLRDGELASAGWFGPDNLPLVPPRFSIARRLLDAWATRQGVVIDQP